MLYPNVHIALGETASTGSDALYVMHMETLQRIFIRIMIRTPLLMLRI